MGSKSLSFCEHIGIITNNSKRLVDFYTRKFEFVKQKEEILSASLMKPLFGLSFDSKLAKLASGNMMIEIFEPVKARLGRKAKNSAGFNHFGFAVDGRERFVKKLKRKKVKVIEIKRNDRSVYFAVDPDGNRIEIRELRK